jgi:hypothetical protein
MAIVGFWRGRVVSVSGEPARADSARLLRRPTAGSSLCSAKGRLVVNLPRDRVDTLIGSATYGPFDAGKRRHMTEWLTVADDEETWVDRPFHAEFGNPRTVRASAARRAQR